MAAHEIIRRRKEWAETLGNSARDARRREVLAEVLDDPTAAEYPTSIQDVEDEVDLRIATTFGLVW